MHDSIAFALPSPVTDVYKIRKQMRPVYYNAS